MTLEDLYTANFNIVYGYLFRLCGNQAVAEDLTSETFLKAFSKFDAFRGDCKVSTWLCRIAKNEYLHYRRRHQRQVPLDAAALPDEAFFEEAVADRDTAVYLHKLLRTLEEPYKEVFILKVFAELSYREIAAVTEQSETWARVTYYRAKNKLRERMGTDGV